ncbi:hypothetical protein F5Y12DRAFT_767182 [Xylaria sp. FL1777]|nr:hypothetical protein F5Y12DRAFT_767182 [Xylaria sp. FL1777]
MSSSCPVPKSALGLGPDPDQDRRHLCQDVVDAPSGQKRRIDDHNSNEKIDLQVKRPKVIEQYDGVPNPTAETLLELASSPALKKICLEVLSDKIAGEKLREELLLCTQDILAQSRAEADKERREIVAEADRKIREVVETAWQNKRWCECDYWPRALDPSFRRIKALHDRGSLAEGPEMAWKALIKVTAFCIHDWDDGELKISGRGEEDCDEFHDDADELMLRICKAQEKNGKVSWLKDGRKEEIRGLQEKAEAQNDRESYTYRYLNTLGFLEQF